MTGCVDCFCFREYGSYGWLEAKPSCGIAVFKCWPRPPLRCPLVASRKPRKTLRYWSGSCVCNRFSHAAVESSETNTISIQSIQSNPGNLSNLSFDSTNSHPISKSKFNLDKNYRMSQNDLLHCKCKLHCNCNGNLPIINLSTKLKHTRISCPRAPSSARSSTNISRPSWSTGALSIDFKTFLSAGT